MTNFGKYLLLTLGLFCLSLAALIGLATLSLLVEESGTNAATDGIGTVASVIVVLIMAVPVGFIIWLGRYLLRKARADKPEAGAGAKTGSIFLLFAGIIIGLTGLSLVVAMVIAGNQEDDFTLFSASFLSGVLAIVTFFGPPSGAAFWLGISILKAGKTAGTRKTETPPKPTKVPSSSSQYRMVGGDREPLLHRPAKVPASSQSEQKAETLTCKGCGAKKTAVAGEAAICDYCGTALR